MSLGTFEARLSDQKYTVGPEIERSYKLFMRGLVPEENPMHILDVGCGTGLNAQILAKKGHCITGVDISPVAIEKFNAAGFAGHVCDISEGLPFSENSFDAVYASEVIEHLLDTKRFLEEISRVLRPGGVLFLSTPNSAFFPYRLLAIFGKTLTEVQHSGHVRFFSLRGLGDSIKDAGLNIKKISGRSIYCILGDIKNLVLSKLLKLFGFQRELRFKTGKYFWYIGGFVEKASCFWTDTLIVVAKKK